MRLLLACLLWFIVSLHVVGGAAWFHRRFPRESTWLGFLLPGLGFVCVMNFLEHGFGMPTLLWLLSGTALFCTWHLLHPQTRWKALVLPTGIFLTSFAFTLTLRALKPDILPLSSGPHDLSLVSSYCMGRTLPLTNLLFAPHNTFFPYSASVLTRLLNLDVGTGFNLSYALLSAWICFALAAMAESVLFPVVARQRTLPYRLLVGVFAVSGLIWFLCRCERTFQTTPWNDDVLHLEGIGVLGSDPVKAKIFKVISRFKGQIIQPGLPRPGFRDNGAMASFTKNDVYITGEAEMQAIYEGKDPQALPYLRRHDIAALVIWPDDRTPDDVLASLKEQLSPAYEYIDFRAGSAPNAGVFVYCPWLDSQSPPPLRPEGN